MKWQDRIKMTYVINLERCVDRKEHTIKEFRRVGIEKYKFFKAVDINDSQIDEIYKDRVFKFPPCFRCGKKTCKCFNNILIPQHIGNFCSFINLFAEISKSDYHDSDLIMITEDDLVFHDNHEKTISGHLSEDNFSRNNINLEQPLLIRMSRPLGDKHICGFELSKDKILSNPCFIINKLFAKEFTKYFENKIINTTSDIVIHQIFTKENDKVQDFTMYPLPTYELSWYGTTCRIPSEIHPKGINTEDKMRESLHIKSIEYKKYLYIGHLGVNQYLAKYLKPGVGLNNIDTEGIAGWQFAVEDTKYPNSNFSVPLHNNNNLRIRHMGKYYFDNIIHCVIEPYKAINLMINIHRKYPNTYLFEQKYIEGLPEYQGLTIEEEVEVATKIYIEWNKLCASWKPDSVLELDVPSDLVVNDEINSMIEENLSRLSYK